MAESVHVKVGDCVLLSKTIGTVLYIGPVDWDKESSTTYVGLELVSSIPNGHNGCYHNKHYFKCKPKHGVLLPISSVVRKIKPRELIYRLSEFKQNIKRAQNKHYNLTKSLQFNSNTNNPKQETINVRIEGAVVEQNNDYYMILKNQSTQIVDGYSVKISKHHIHYTSPNKSEPKNTTNNDDIHLSDVANYWLKLFDLDSFEVDTHTTNVLDELQRYAKQNAAHCSDITSICEVMRILKDLYKEWHTIHDSNHFLKQKCNGDILVCRCAHRVIIQMKVYQKFMKHAFSDYLLFDIMNSFKGYSRHQVLEDWDHICYLHLFERDNTQFIDWALEKQETFAFLEERLGNCDVNECVSFRRIRKRGLHDNTFDAYHIPNKWRNSATQPRIEKEINVQDQLDIIHNKIFHSVSKHASLTKYNSAHHVGLQSRLLVSNETNDEQKKNPSYDEQYIIDSYGALPEKVPIEIDMFDRWKYYQFWFTKMGINNEYLEQIKGFKSNSDELKDMMTKKPEIKQIADLVGMYIKWHFCVSQSCNYDFISNYPCDMYSKKQPCKIIKRVSVLMEFLMQWMRDMKHVEIAVKRRLSCCDFIESLDLYDVGNLKDDWQHLVDFHLVPNQEIFTHLLYCNWKKQKVSIYEYFMQKVGKCDIRECKIFERYNICKYDEDYSVIHKHTLFAIQSEDMETDKEWKEIELQKKLDECHVMLWHSHAKYITMKLQNTDEFEYFADTIKEWKQPDTLAGEGNM